jgi:hypothetical protein
MFRHPKKSETFNVKDIWIGDQVELVDTEGRIVARLPAKDVKTLDVIGRITGNSNELHILFPEPVACDWNPGAGQLHCERRLPEAAVMQ